MPGGPGITERALVGSSKRHLQYSYHVAGRSSGVKSECGEEAYSNKRDRSSVSLGLSISCESNVTSRDYTILRWRQELITMMTVVAVCVVWPDASSLPHLCLHVHILPVLPHPTSSTVKPLFLKSTKTCFK
ncbi:hypothetical protein XENORESO_001681 [Xenotaenia resolanae]|uniref:Uncharacterized protein n=1 Tax=Xenotaenia resolanae TaxID=208358 RepID=A0ABV0W0E2_9TELE